MIKRYSYSRPRDLSALHDELIAAGIRPSYVGGDPDDPDGIVLEVPDGTDAAAVVAVVTAHDGAAALAKAQAARQAERDDDAAVAPLIAEIDAALADSPASGIRTLLRAVRLLLVLERRRRGG